jgi:putative tryptophan/tyrosine transport system substrate-binding protein
MQLDQLERREAIAVIVGAAVGLPFPARARRPTVPVIGYLYVGAPEASAHLITAYRNGLSETGYVEGRNVAIEFRFAYNDPDRLPDLAAGLVRNHVAVIATPSSVPATLAAKAATMTIPIVFNTAGDPVQAGLVASLSRPGGNVTGVSSMNPGLTAQRLGLLLELVPGATNIAVLVNPNNRFLGASAVADAHAAASTIGRQIEVLTASTGGDIDTVFANLPQKRVGALVVSPDVLFVSRREQLVTLAARHAMPTIYSVRELPEAGGLMSYGPSLANQFRQAGVYTGRILNGEVPADLPVLQSSKFEFVINLKSAKSLGLQVPPVLLARADEVIEYGERTYWCRDRH